jgi:hypothetical protein
MNRVNGPCSLSWASHNMIGRQIPWCDIGYCRLIRRRTFRPWMGRVFCRKFRLVVPRAPHRGRYCRYHVYSTHNSGSCSLRATHVPIATLSAGGHSTADGRYHYSKPKRPSQSKSDGPPDWLWRCLGPEEASRCLVCYI